MPFFITVSESKLTMYSLRQEPVPTYLYEIKLPKLKAVQEFFSNQHEKAKVGITRDDFNNSDTELCVKCICAQDLKKNLPTYNDDDTGNEMLHNPDLAPFLFLVIRKFYVYVMAPSKQIKFAYFTKKENTQILDAFVIGDKSLIVIEKNTSAIKVFHNYLQEPTKYKEFNVSNENEPHQIQQTCNSSGSVIFGVQLKVIMLTILFENDEIRQLLFEYKSGDLLEDYESDNSEYGGEMGKFDELFFSCSSEPEDVDTRLKSHDLTFNSFLTVKMLTSIKSSGLKVACLLKPKQSGVLRAMLKSETRLNLVYLTTEDGSLIIIEHNIVKSRCKILKNIAKQPILEVKSGQVGRSFCLRTKDYFYIIHKNELDQTEESDDFCKIEIKERVDYVEILASDYFLLGKSGIIEMYKVKCTSKTHRLQLICSINTTSRNITDLIFIGKQIFFISTLYLYISSFQSLREGKNRFWLITKQKYFA